MKTLVLDIETTGLPPKGATYEKDFMNYPYIVTMAWKVNQDKTKEFVINQEGRLIPQEATNIHGITNEMAQASQFTLIDVLRLVLADGEDVEIVIGHNVYFDTSTIKANILRLIKEGKISQQIFVEFSNLLHKDRRVDTMQSTIKFCGLPGAYGLKYPKLTELYSKLFNKTFDAHSSGNDVDATHECYLELIRIGIIPELATRELWLKKKSDVECEIQEINRGLSECEGQIKHLNSVKAEFESKLKDILAKEVK